MANESDYAATTPPEERATTPDLQSATGLPGGGGSQDSLLGLFQNTVPNTALLGLLQPPSQGMGYAQALAGGISAARGQANPVSAIIDQQQQQSMAVASMLEKMQARQDLNDYRKTEISNRNRQFGLEQEKFKNLQQEQALKKNEASITAMRGILDNETTPPEVRNLVGPQYAAAMKKTFGVDLPDSVVQRTMKTEEQNAVLMDIQNGLDPALILKNHPAMSPQDLQSYMAIKDNPTVLERLKLKSPDEREKLRLEIQKLNAEMLEAQHPELRLDPKVGAATLMKAREWYPGKEYKDLSNDEQVKVYKMTVLEQRQQVLDMERAKAGIQEQKRLDLLPKELAIRQAAAQTAKGAEPVGEQKMFWVDAQGNLAPNDMTVAEAKATGKYAVITQPQLDALNTGQQAMLILQNLKATVDGMKKEGLFVKHSGLVGTLWDQGNIAYKKSFGSVDVERQLLNNLETQKGHMVILMRQLGEKGVKAIGAMAPGMEAMTPMAGAPAIESFLGQLESEIRILGSNTKTPQAFTGTPTMFPRRSGRDIPNAILPKPQSGDLELISEK